MDKRQERIEVACATISVSLCIHRISDEPLVDFLERIADNVRLKDTETVKELSPVAG